MLHLIHFKNLNNLLMPKKIVSLGELNIYFSLKLSENELEKYSINWAQLNELKDLSFIQKKSNIYDKIEIKSKDDTINFLLYLNRINKNKIFIQYITLNEIIYDEEQEKFKNFINDITGSNFLYISSQKIFNSINNRIDFELIYNNESKIFPMTNRTCTSNIVEKNNKNNEENKNFIELSNNKSQFDYFDYLYLDYKRIKEELCNIISFESWNNFCFNIKKNYGIKIISYFNDFIINGQEDKKFFSLIDFHIFQKKDNAINVLKNLNQNEENHNIKKYKLKINNNQEKETFKNKIMKFHNNNYLLFNSKNNSNNNNTPKTSKIYYRNKSNGINKIKHSIEKPYIKNNLLDFLKENASKKENNKFLFEDKILIFLDEFKEAIFCMFNKREKNPFIYNFKFKIFPDINIHNIDEINKYKNLLKKNQEIYSFIFLSGVLSELIQENNMDDETFIKSFLLGNNCIKTILSYEKNNNYFPSNKKIFLTEINKKDIIKFNYTPQSESRFILDGNDINIKKKLYNPLLDKFSQTYFSNEATRDVIRKNGLIDKKGNLVYDQIYKDSMGMNPKYKKNIYLTDRNLLNDIYSMNVLKDIKSKEIETINEIIKNKFVLDKKMTGYNKKVYQYSIYSNAMKKKILPKIKSNSKNKYKTYNSFNSSKKYNINTANNH